MNTSASLVSLIAVIKANPIDRFLNGKPQYELNSQPTVCKPLTARVNTSFGKGITPLCDHRASESKTVLEVLILC